MKKRQITMSDSQSPDVSRPSKGKSLEITK